VQVLGTVQDGGLPHAGCSCVRCEEARSDPKRSRRVTSLAIRIPSSDAVYLIDATPDLPVQLEAVRRSRDTGQERTDRKPVDGILLTHAHIGHYLGLAFLGFEVIHAHEVPVYCTPSMAAYLRENGPWDQLVRFGNIRLHEILPGQELALEGSVTVRPLRVPHRQEYTDTVGVEIRGPKRSILYVSDTDGWSAWDPPMTEVVATFDVAILDGTFFSMAELPGRDISSIGHPLITETMDLLEPAVRSGGLSVYFTHMNHSNPALQPAGPERAEIEERGFGVLAEGQLFPL
jgi:pyrroloquinoline quinone biosynthesis protein B